MHIHTVKHTNMYFVVSENEFLSLAMHSDIRKYPFSVQKRYEQVFFVNHGTKLDLGKFAHKLLIIGRTSMIQVSR